MNYIGKYNNMKTLTLFPAEYLSYDEQLEIEQLFHDNGIKCVHFGSIISNEEEKNILINLLIENNYPVNFKVVTKNATFAFIHHKRTYFNFKYDDNTLDWLAEDYRCLFQDAQRENNVFKFSWKSYLKHMAESRLDESDEY